MSPKSCHHAAGIGLENWRTTLLPAIGEDRQTIRRRKARVDVLQMRVYYDATVNIHVRTNQHDVAIMHVDNTVPI